MLTQLNECSNIQKEIIIHYFEEIISFVTNEFVKSHRYIHSVGVIDCGESQVKMREYTLDEEPVQLIQIAVNCSLSYRELEQKHLQGFDFSWVYS